MVMSRIICSLEDWDSILNYYRPNGSSKTWYIREKKELSIPLMWGYWNILTEDKEMFSTGNIKHTVAPKYSDSIVYVPKELIKNVPHIYVINVHNPNFFNQNRSIGFDCISQEYIHDIINGNAKILIIYQFEGYSGIDGNIDFDIIEEWRVKANLPINSIFFVCGNLLSEKIVREKNLGYEAKGIHFFEPWNKYNGNLLEFKPDNEKYLFLSYNRTFRYQRVFFLHDLYKKNLFDRGLISFYQLKDPKSFQNLVDDDFIKFLLENTPLKINHNYDLYYNLACNLHLEDYERTFISLVTESLVDNGTLFFSEKIWKPIMVGHPFMLYGNQYSLQYLKNLGYRTFDRWFDESYDNEPNMRIRSMKIAEQIEKFKDKTIEELINIREEMKEVCSHNQNKFRELYKKNYDSGDKSIQLENVFFKIWDEIKGDYKNKELI